MYENGFLEKVMWLNVYVVETGEGGGFWAQIEMGEKIYWTNRRIREGSTGIEITWNFPKEVLLDDICHRL